MNQELKQRIIGAIVVTALAAIFIPMLFDDPIENSGQSVSELAIPATPLNSDEISANKLPSNADQVLNAPNNESETLVNTEEENELSADNQLSQEIPANNDSTVNNADQRFIEYAPELFNFNSYNWVRCNLSISFRITYEMSYLLINVYYTKILSYLIK